ncbi:glycosyltransferase [Devriesea agamarum]|uniref:glycosyltransferase n=1 Tax=Devriesea agamarum TaxID=472569 RepID=UPI00071CA693|nr:glycosyltransferase [Devriesea agamarum]
MSGAPSNSPTPHEHGEFSACPLRLAYISLHTSPLAAPGRADAGGMNVVELQQALALARRGHQVDLITRRSDQDSPDVTDVAPGVRLIQIEAGPPAPLAKSDMEQCIQPFRERLASLIESGPHRYDLVHSHHWFSGVAALPVTRATGIAHVQSFHSVAAPERAVSLAAGEPSESPGRIPGEREAATASDLVVAVSDAEAATIRARYGVSARRLAVVRPGVDTDMFHPSPSTSGCAAAIADPGTSAASTDGAITEDAPVDAPSRRPYVLFAARLQPLKAPDLALDLLSRLDPATRPKLVLAGAASDDFADYDHELHRMVRERGLEADVEFVGACSRERLAELMRGACLFLLTSWSETFGLVALEAQASGVPVIAWQGAGGVVEAVEAGGLVMACRDADVWAEAIESLLGDRPRWLSLSRRAREFALGRTWGHVAHQLEALYTEVVR